jgi:hypothetical protein
MEILKAYNLIKDDTINLDIKGKVDEPLFNINNISQILNINEYIDDLDNSEKKIYKNSTYLTENGLYRILLLSENEIANTFQKWTYNSLKQTRLNGFYKLSENNEIDKQLIEYKENILNHKNLINLYDFKNIIYICVIKTFYDYKYIIKIGLTNNIKQKLLDIQNKYNIREPLLIYAIEVNNNLIEKKVYQHENIKKFYIPFNINKNTISKKTYYVDEYNAYFNFPNIIKNLKTEELKNKNKELDLEIKKLSLELSNKDDIENNISDSESETDIDLSTCNFEIKTRKNSIKTPKVYQYSPSDLSTPIKIFDSPTEVERTYSFISPSPLRAAAKNNTIYKDYRWLFLLRSETLPEKIPDTIETKHKSTEIKYISMIDIKKTKIIEVFASQKDAVEARNMKSRSFTRAIQQESISSGHYWKFWEDCSEEMRFEFLKHNNLPEKYKTTTGKKVVQIDPHTNKELKTYNSQREVLKLFQMSALTLKTISQNESIHNGYKWKLV